MKKKNVSYKPAEAYVEKHLLDSMMSLYSPCSCCFDL